MGVCVAYRGYEMEFWNVSMYNVDHIAHFKHGVGGILIDGDGSLGVDREAILCHLQANFATIQTAQSNIPAMLPVLQQSASMWGDTLTSPFWNTRDKNYTLYYGK